MTYRKRRKTERYYSPEELLDLILPYLEYRRDKQAPNGDYLCKCVFHRHNHTDDYKMNVGLKGWYCNSRGKGGGLYELAEHLNVLNFKYKEVSKMLTPEKTYGYADEEGKLLFQVIRKPGKKFLQRQNADGKSVWNLKGVRRVIYHLKEVLESARDGAPVFIPEGEKDVDNVRALGLVATTNPMGAGKWRKEYSECLRGRDLILLPDNDKEGKKHMLKVASICHGIAKSIKIVELPGLGEKEDISDWLEKGNTKEDLLKLVDETPIWVPDEKEAQRIVNESTQKENQATQLINHILKMDTMLFYDQRGNAFAKIKTEQGWEILPIDSLRFRQWVSHTSWRLFGKAIHNETVSTVQNQLEGLSIHEGEMYELNVRNSWHDDAIFTDLDSHKMVRIDKNGWRVEPAIETPLFRWYPHMKSLPEPERGGDPWKVFKYLNMRNKVFRHLYLCYLVAAMVPEIQIPAIVFHGVKGSAKSTMLMVTKRILDPSEVLVRGIAPDQTEFSIAAWQNRMLCFDNLSKMPGWLSNAICRMITGEGHSKRKLYTDEEVTYMKYKGIIGLAGINLVVDKPDLLDRSIIFQAEAISPEERRLESEFWSDFDNNLPFILGGLFKVLSDALRFVQDLKLPQLPRMADFALYGAAVSMALGRTAEAFLDAYNQNIRFQNLTAIEANTVAPVIIPFIADVKEWEGSPTELLKTLDKFRSDCELIVDSTKWPKDPGSLTKKLNEIRPNLEAMGILVKYQRTRFGRLITLKLTDDSTLVELNLVDRSDDDGTSSQGLDGAA
jgi:hypothetical protein